MKRKMSKKTLEAELFGKKIKREVINNAKDKESKQAIKEYDDARYL